MSAIALELIASMIKLGDIGPIQRGEFRKEHCTDGGSQSLFDYISHYREITQGMGHVPAMSVIKERFPHLQLPETSDNIDLVALVYEARSYKTKLSVQALANSLISAIEAIDPIAELRGFRTELDAVMREAAATTDISFQDVAMEILDAYQNREILKKGIMWPWPALQEATQGMQNGEFYIIAGRPKSRKTFIALYVAAFLMKYCHLRVLFFSPEMPSRQVMLRFIAFLGSVHYTPFKKGDLSREEEQMLYVAVGEILDVMNGIVGPNGEEYSEPDINLAPGSEGSFVVVKATGQPVTFITAKIKEHRPHVVIVDSFYRLHAPGTKTYDADWKAVSSVSRMLKDMAMEHNVVMIGTHQLNREAEEKVGSLANMGYSDAIGQDCDMALRVITQTRAEGDRSALLVLGARETDIEGVLIHNEPCNNFEQIEPLRKGNKKLLLAMMQEEVRAEDADAAEGDGAPPNLRTPGQKKGKANVLKNVKNENGGFGQGFLAQPPDEPNA